MPLNTLICPLRSTTTTELVEKKDALELYFSLYALFKMSDLQEPFGVGMWGWHVICVLVQRREFTELVDNHAH